MFYPISFCFHFVDIFYPYPDWGTFYLVFSFGQHQLWWEGVFPFALWKMPTLNPLKNDPTQNALFKKAIMNKSIFSSGIGGHFERANVKFSFALSKMPFYIPWKNALIQNAPLKRTFWIRAFCQKIFKRAFLKEQKGISTK